MLELLIFSAASAIIAAMVSVVVRRSQPLWNSRRVVIFSAFPIPGAGAALCAFVFVNAATSSREECGVDACGMAIAFSLVGIGYCLVAFAVGSAASLWAFRLLTKQ